jgi:hypothetical protein
VIDLRRGAFSKEHNPPEGKEFSSYVRIDELPPLTRDWVVDEELRVLEKVVEKTE